MTDLEKSRWCARISMALFGVLIVHFAWFYWTIEARLRSVIHEERIVIQSTDNVGLRAEPKSVLHVETPVIRKGDVGVQHSIPNGIVTGQSFITCENRNLVWKPAMNQSYGAVSKGYITTDGKIVFGP